MGPTLGPETFKPWSPRLCKLVGGYGGESLRNTAKSLKLLGMRVSHQTVYKWIGKYVRIMKDYLDKLTPQVSDTWRADELYLKVNGIQGPNKWVTLIGNASRNAHRRSIGN